MPHLPATQVAGAQARKEAILMAIPQAIDDRGVVPLEDEFTSPGGAPERDYNLTRRYDMTIETSRLERLKRRALFEPGEAMAEVLRSYGGDERRREMAIAYLVGQPMPGDDQ